MEERMNKRERLEAIKKMHQQEKSCNEIATALGCSKSTVKRDLKELGLSARESYRMTEKVKMLYRKGFTPTEIGKEIDKSTAYVSACLKKLGVSKYTFGERDLLDENTQYVKPRKIILEKLEIGEKTYYDVTPIFLPW